MEWDASWLVPRTRPAAPSVRRLVPRAEPAPDEIIAFTADVLASRAEPPVGEAESKVPEGPRAQESA